jgi:hypothetical protein
MWGRLAVGAALVGAVLGMLGDAYHLYWAFLTDLDRSELLDTAAYRAHGVLVAAGYALLLLALPGLVLHAPRAWRQPGWAGVALAFVGTTMVAGDYWAESVVTPGVLAGSPALADADASGLHLALVVLGFALHAAGWLLVAIGAGRSGLPRWLAVGLGAGAVLAFPPIPGSNLVLFAMVGAAGWWLKGALAAPVAGPPAAPRPTVTPDQAIPAIPRPGNAGPR